MTTDVTRYSVGFAFDQPGKHVVLIRKNRPTWQRGLLNGIGGHIEVGEVPREAQAREFYEETGINSTPEQWIPFALLTGTKFELHCFSLFSNEVYYGKSTTDEDVSLYSVSDLPKLATISNLQWLIPAALDQELYYPELFIREGMTCPSS